MKKLLFIVASFLTTQAIAQEVKSDTQKTATGIKMTCSARPPNNNDNIAYFVNGEHTPQALIIKTDPKSIESIGVKKTTICIDNIEYTGQVFIYTKNFNQSIVKKSF